jgi:diacylglycerol kinase (ATP)
LNSGEKQKKTHLYVVLNPVAGNASAEDIRDLLTKNFPSDRYTCDVYETTGKENVAQLTREAVKNGADQVYAAGGDGTVAGVVNGLVGTGIPLGIIPVGTGNGLARALRLPLDTQEAVELLASENELLPLDLMQVGDQYFTLNVSAGISGDAMRNTPAPVKRRFGMLAYTWTIIKRVIGVQSALYTLTIDGVPTRVRAAEVLVSNGTLLEKPMEALGPPQEFKDGTLDAYIVTARSLFGYVRVLWEVVLKPPRKAKDVAHWKIARSIVIDAAGVPQPTQGDGEPIGKTPLEVTVAHEAIKVIVSVGINEKGKNNEHTSE